MIIKTAFRVDSIVRVFGVNLFGRDYFPHPSPSRDKSELFGGWGTIKTGGRRRRRECDFPAQETRSVHRLLTDRAGFID